MKLFRLLALFLLSFAASAQLEEVPLGTFSIELQSLSNHESPGFLSEILSQINIFLNDFFTENYSGSNFFQVAIYIQSFNMPATSERPYTFTFDFTGTAIFSEPPIPSEESLMDLVTDAFQGTSINSFLVSLLGSSNSVLARMTNIVVSVEGLVVSVKEIDQPDTVYEVLDDPSEDEPLVDTRESTEDDGLDIVEIAIITGSVGAGILLVIAIAYYFWPEATSPPPTKKDNPNRGRDRKAVAVTNDVEAASTRSPSPIRSITSQDSSKFTYNPLSIASQDSSKFTYNPPSKASFDSKTAGSLSHLDSSKNFDLEAWQSKNTISVAAPAPFGNDISAIHANEAKDLSLIEEGEEDNVPETYLNQETLAAYERYERTAATRFVDTSLISEESVARFSEGSDVINDLKNLSQQIDRHRGNRR